MKIKSFKAALLLALLGFGNSTKPIPTPSMDDAFAIACIPLAAYRLYKAYQDRSFYNGALGISATACAVLPFMAPATLSAGVAAGFRTISGLDMAWPSTNQKKDPRDLTSITAQSNNIACNECEKSAINATNISCNDAKGEVYCRTCLEQDRQRLKRWGLRTAANLWQLTKTVIAVPTILKAAPIAITAAASYISKSNWLSKFFSNKFVCPTCKKDCQNVNICQSCSATYITSESGIPG